MVVARRTWIPLLSAVFISLLGLSAPAVRARPDVARLDASVLRHPVWSGDDMARTMAIILQLEGPTTLDLYRAQRLAVGDTSAVAANTLDGVFAAVARRQAPARAFIEASGARVISTYDTATNGFLAYATRPQLAALTRTPGLRRIYRAPEHVPLLADAVPLIGAEAVAEKHGYTGRDVNVAIIDTGIDYTHRSFGGLGREDDYYQNNPGTVEPRTFPTRKVIGGYDFAGSWYSGGNEPTPDDDPLDEHSHGTHVAGITAGAKGVREVYHGVAPDAKLIALKVFGRGGGTNLTVDAIEWAIEANLGRPVEGKAARVDVINMSLGSSWANGVEEFLGVIRRATEAGIVVVASAGNSGNAAFVTGAPAAADHALSIASTYPSGETGDAILAITDGNNSSPESLEAVEADARLSKQINDVRNLRAEAVGFGTGCDAETGRPDAEEKIVLMAAGSCPEQEMLGNAKEAGAVGAVIYGDPMQPLGVDSDDKFAFPVVMVAGADGQRLVQSLGDGHKVEIVMAVQFKGRFDKAYLTDVISEFSSRGPSRSAAFKPDLAAPGSNIVAPLIASGDKGVSFSGTSMAGPIVAGSAAVLLERLRHDGLAPADAPLPATGAVTALDVGALLVNTADATVWDGDNRREQPVPLARGGAGRVNLLRAVEARTVARAGTIASLSFGIQPFRDTYLEQQTLRIRNLTGQPKHYRLRSEFLMPDDANAGVHIGVPEEIVTVPGGMSGAVNVQAQASGGALKPYAALGGQYAMSGGPRLTDSEFDGFVVVTEVDDSGTPVAGGDLVRVPVYFLPRAASEIAAPDQILVGPTTRRATVRLPNAGPQPGRVELFASLGQDGEETDLADRLDVGRVGARVLAEGGRRFIDLAVHTTGRRHIPYDSTVAVLLDVNRDGRLDWAAYNEDWADLSSGGRRASGQQDTVLQVIARSAPLQLGTIFRQPGPVYADMNLESRIAILRVDAALLGFGAQESISFDAVVWHRPNFDDVAAGGTTTYDAVPDDGLVIGGEGRLGIGPGRLSFDQSRLAFDVDRWSFAVAAGGDQPVTVSRQGDDAFLWALFPQNFPDGADSQLVEILLGDAPTPTQIASATPGGPTGTATPGSGVTPSPTAPPDSGVRRIFLPSALRAGELGSGSRR
jgi:subtilisin family serine protease